MSTSPQRQAAVIADHPRRQHSLVDQADHVGMRNIQPIRGLLRGDLRRNRYRII